MTLLTYHRISLIGALTLLLLSSIAPNLLASDVLTVAKIDASGWHEPHKPEHTIDRDAETTWSADGYGQFVQYELSEEIGLTELEVDLRHSESRSYQLRVQTSTDGQKWETVLLADTTLGIDGFERLEPKPSQARYVRIVGLGNS